MIAVLKVRTLQARKESNGKTLILNQEKRLWVIKEKETKASVKNRKKPDRRQKRNENRKRKKAFQKQF
jgi:prophage tail gpP-like protein